MFGRTCLNATCRVFRRQQRIEVISSRGHRSNSRPFACASAQHHREAVHATDSDDDVLDLHIKHLAQSLYNRGHVSVHDLHGQYRHKAGTIIDRVVPYEEKLPSSRRAEVLHKASNNVDEQEGDGLVLVIHAQFDQARQALTKMTVCSGFVVNASLSNHQQGDTVVTCAHTLEEVSR